MTNDDATRDDVTSDDAPRDDQTHNDVPRKAPAAEAENPPSREPDAADAVASGEGAGVEPGGGEQTDVDAEQASVDEGMLSLDDLLSGAESSSCSIDGTCD